MDDDEGSSIFSSSTNALIVPSLRTTRSFQTLLHSRSSHGQEGLVDEPDENLNYDGENIPAIFQQAKKCCKSWIWESRNGEEYLERGKWRWRCAICRSTFIIQGTINGLMLITRVCSKGPYRPTAVHFSDASTRNMLDHLRIIHHITKEDQEGSSFAVNRIETAFGNTTAKIVFNKDVFRLLLLRWIIVNNISFRQVQDNAFRALLSYLCSCVSNCNLITLLQYVKD
jgi:hypothetical protein